MKTNLLAISLFVFSLTFISHGAKAQNVYYVTAEADGTADGLSWANAISLEAAIAKTTNASTDIIFVKKGTYTAPAAAQATSNGSVSGLGFLIDTKNDVTIYGNCEGTESETNLPSVNENTVLATFLKAPVDGNNVALGRVITIYKSNVKFIGFDIFGGDAAKVSSASAFGAQVYGGSVWINGKGTLKYCKVHGGTASSGGGGVYLSVNNTWSPATVEACEIYNNSVTNDVTNKGGGGIYISESNVYVNNSVIRNNTAARAGGIYVSNSSTTPTNTTLISNCIIKDNTVTATSSTAPGGVQFLKSGTIVNCLISGNTGYTAGGVALGSVSQIINSTVVNNTVTSNGSSDAGGIIVNAGSVRNCIVWGNTKNNGSTNIDLRLASNSSSATNVSTVTNSCYNVSSVSTNTYMPVLTDNLVATDPLFTSTSDFTLSSSSPCINSGDNTVYDAAYTSADLNNNNRIVNTTIDMGAYEYFSSQTINSTTYTSAITGSDTYGINICGHNELIVDDTKTFNTITAAPASKLTINNGASLTSGTINLQSDATGTATFVNNGTATITTANVQQYLTADRNWYVSSPISSAKGSELNLGSSVQYWDEPSASWQTLPIGNVMIPTKGYISVASVGSSSTGNVIFSGTLNDGNQSISLTRTGSGLYAGFNLIGNPYPSYLNVMSAITAANDDATIVAGTPTTVVEPTIWYRTKGASAYYFETINTTTGVGTNNSNTGTVTGYAPPMQAFWVRVASGQTAATLNFTNSMRSHSKTAVETGTAATTPLKISPINSNVQKLLRLRISNGINADEAILVFNPNAKNELDAYDSAKRMNGNSAIPEIYTFLENMNLVINGLNNNAFGNEIPIGFSTGQSNTFSIRASEITNFDPETQIILKDKLLGKELNLTDGSDYTFVSDATTTKERFSIIFKSTININDINQLTDNKYINIYRNNNNRIVIDLVEQPVKEANVTVYNSNGQELMNKKLINSYTELYTSFATGVYIVKVNTSHQKVIRKINLN